MKGVDRIYVVNRIMNAQKHLFEILEYQQKLSASDIFHDNEAFIFQVVDTAGVPHYNLKHISN